MERNAGRERLRERTCAGKGSERRSLQAFNTEAVRTWGIPAPGPLEDRGAGKGFQRKQLFLEY